MKRLAILIAAPALVAVPAFAADDHREAGAHVHGEGVVAIAVENGVLEMELEAPGMDIVGFEHEAKSDGDKAAIDKAKAVLGDPLLLFKVPDVAGCKVAGLDVALEDEEHDDEKDGGHDDHDKHDGDKGEEASHASFHATYTLECDNVAALTAIDFAYFKAFPGAQKLVVNIVGTNGQSASEVTRENPILDLSGKL